MALIESDAAILNAAQRYIALQQKTPALLDLAEDRQLSGKPGTVYLKKLGHKPLTAKDFENVVIAHGSTDDKQIIQNFVKAQIDLRERLGDTRSIGLVLEQAEMTRDLFYYRVKHPEKWKAEEMIKVIEVLDRLRV
ncbi:hypothetical protein [Spirosoma rhododendri]|uniref:Uncharacterized protein n=1 Tax=Spirosoma rhododendri TaxID=2728024 RepID=A0A7L5DSY7_9BACT|nr:hypothetical protein [Spirosoma rhododendri]QJD81546.1 hypothetical protein HH216_24555 [Spirosoma rhododendri]